MRDGAADAKCESCAPIPIALYTTTDGATRFLAALDPKATEFTFQTFDDNKDRKDPMLARILHGTLAQHSAELRRLNDLGAGIYVTVNLTDFQGRTTNNIVRVRAQFVDLDGAPLDPVLAAMPTPHIVIESSPGKWHVYWLVCDVGLDQFAAIQEALAARFGGDPKVKDLPRVMRLPGFHHRKGEPFLSRIQSTCYAPPYRPADITSEPVVTNAEPVVTNAEPISKSELRKINNAAMVNLGKWVPKLFPAARANNRGGWTISAKALGRNTEEGISISPKGIKDFGLHDIGDAREGKRTPIELIRIWRHIDTAAAAAWLREQLGLTPDDQTPQASILVSLAQSAQLFHTPDLKGYVDVDIGNHRETWPVRSKNFKLWLSRTFFQTNNKPPNREALNSALDQIDARALFESPERPIFVRIGRLDGRIYLDLCDEGWRAVEIDASGWRVIDDPPVRFRRAPGMKALPMPVPGGSIDELRPFLNVQSDAEFVLVVAWTLAVLRDRGPYPILVLSGEQGTAKTFFCSCIRALLDPNIAPNRTMPREERDLYVAANNSYLIAFDNVSGMPYWISDALCRLSTGGGFATRQLYTDDDEMLFAAMRPVILNGIEDSVTRPDLADRSIVLALELILEEDRRSEEDLMTDFEKARPIILGALLTAVATGLRMLPQTKLERLPRMADFALWAAACETALWDKGTFEKAYTENRDNLVETVLEASPVAIALRGFLDEVGEWTGTATQLLDDLNRRDSRDQVRRDRRHWPQTAKLLSGQIRRVAPMLRKSGITITFDRPNQRTIYLKGKPPEEDPI